MRITVVSNILVIIVVGDSEQYRKISFYIDKIDISPTTIVLLEMATRGQYRSYFMTPIKLCPGQHHGETRREGQIKLTII